MQAIAGIQDVLGSWRRLGRHRLPNGTELIAQAPDGDGSQWLHAIYPKLSSEEIRELESAVGRPLPLDLRTFYRTIGGLSLFCGAFCIHSRGSHYLTHGEEALRPPDLARFNHELDSAGWLPADAVAFAENGWDLTVHVCGMGATPTEVVRVDRHTGAQLQRHPTIWNLVAEKLLTYEHLLLGDAARPRV
jgi:hypothetical protein